MAGEGLYSRGDKKGTLSHSANQGDQRKEGGAGNPSDPQFGSTRIKEGVGNKWSKQSAT